MQSGSVGFIGAQPTVIVTKRERPPEKDLYRKMWEKEEYRQYSPGENLVNEFLSQARPKAGSKVIDLGCGTGRAGILLSILGGLKVTFIDFAENCLDTDVQEMIDGQPNLNFIVADLTEKIPEVAEYGFNADVLEHIHPENVDKVLDNCLLACKHVFFNIATREDVFGKTVGHPLHLTVKPYEWWLEKFRERECVIHWSINGEGQCAFYVSAWTDGKGVVDAGKLNSTEEQIRENVKANISGDWQQVRPYPTNETEVMILGGGWSLPEFEDEIRKKREEGVKLITINGTYRWCLERGIKPSALIMVDSRPFNARFSKPVVDGCKYFIASQCHPSVFEGLPKDRTYIWHTSADLIGDLLKERYTEWYPTPGGSTALLRAIPLFRMLGFRKFHLFGTDSCIKDGKHHSYPQSENDSEKIIPVFAHPSDRAFYAHAWMVSQCQEFLDLIKFMGDEFDVSVYGDGLLAHVLNTGAELYEQNHKEKQ